MDVSTRTIFLMKNSHLHTSNIHALSIPLDTGSRVYFLSADSGSRSVSDWIERVCIWIQRSGFFNEKAYIRSCEWNLI